MTQVPCQPAFLQLAQHGGIRIENAIGIKQVFAQHRFEREAIAIGGTKAVFSRLIGTELAGIQHVNMGQIAEGQFAIQPPIGIAMLPVHRTQRHGLRIYLVSVTLPY